MKGCWWSRALRVKSRSLQGALEWGGVECDGAVAAHAPCAPSQHDLTFQHDLFDPYVVSGLSSKSRLLLISMNYRAAFNFFEITLMLDFF